MKNVLFVDKPKTVRPYRIEVDSRLGISADCAETPQLAGELLETTKYGCAVVEPRIYEFIDREKESPMLPLIKELNRRNIPVVIFSTYLEQTFPETFGLQEEVDYDSFFAKPLIEHQTLSDKVVELMQRDQS
ncbi:hypothetical protein CL618_02450 [archaeon]|nr:hypothetical protein [archaeon]|tara:strand:- start:3334 stop:3729 length:396 start_codon:yes stop_codon:yes gene_type:complete